MTEQNPQIETTEAVETVEVTTPVEVTKEPTAETPTPQTDVVPTVDTVVDEPTLPRVKVFDFDLPGETVEPAETDILRGKVQELESIIQDPFIAKYITAKQAGKPFEEFVKESSPVNYDAMRTQAPEMLYKEFLKKEYPEYANNQEWLDDEYASFLDGRESPTTKGQIDQLKDIAKKLSEKQPTSTGYEVDPLVGQKVREATERSYTLAKESLVGKRLLSDNGEGGIEFTEKHYQKGQAVIDYWARNSVSKDGSPTPEFLKFIMLAANMEELLGHAITASSNAGKVEVLREKANLAPSSQQGNRVPQGWTTTSNSKERSEVLKREKEHLKKIQGQK